MSKPTYEQLEAQVKALAAENVGLRSAITNIHDKYMNWEGLCDAFESALNTETPATDSWLTQLRNEARAEGVEMFAAEEHAIAERRKRRGLSGHSVDRCMDLAEFADKFARQLREGKAGEVQNA